MRKVLILVALAVVASAVVALMGEENESDANTEDDGTIADYLGV